MRPVVALLGLLLIPFAFSNTYAHILFDPALKSTVLVTGLQSPTSMAFIGPGDILVLQKQDGRVRRVTGGVLQEAAVLDVSVDGFSERGLLGIAVHPDFPTVPFVYLYLTESATGGDTSGAPVGNRVYRFTWTGTVLQDPVLILALPVLPGPNHNGGSMVFGPDGKLYLVIGDLNHNGQLQNIAGGPPPDDTGVIFRLNDDGTVPADNPFVALGDPTARYFAYGIRNSFGLAFDPVTDKLWMTENGPDTFDEINLVEPGFNSGWNRVRGPIARTGLGVADLVQLPGSHYTDPKFSWFRPVAPTGLAFIGTGLGPQYENNLFVGDFLNGTLYRFQLNAARDGFVLNSPPLADLVADSSGELGEVTFGIHFGGVTDLKVGPDGLLYVLSLPQGVIHVISRPATTPPTPVVANAGSSTADSMVFGTTAMGPVMPSSSGAASSPRPEAPVAAGSEVESGPALAPPPAQTPTVVENGPTSPSEIAVTNVGLEPTLWSGPTPSPINSGESVNPVTATPSVAADERAGATDWPAASPSAAAPRIWGAPLRATNGLGMTILAAIGLYVLGRRARPIRRPTAAATTAPKSGR